MKTLYSRICLRAAIITDGVARFLNNAKCLKGAIIMDELTRILYEEAMERKSDAVILAKYGIDEI